MHRALVLPSRLLPLALVGALAVVLGGAGPARAATTVDLGTAGAFAVLAGSGITNTGQSAVTGDIGTSPTPAETGVDPCPSAANCVTLVGSNHPADATALQAKKDLTKAYDAAAAQSPTASLSADLGGSTFAPGVYNTAGALGLTGQVTLDAKGVGDAVFVFQIGSTLVTGSASSVRLLNGASACNVFFQVGKAATLGSSSTFRGTILAHDSISLDDAVTVDGRLLGGEQASGAGAVTLIHDTITTPTCTAAGSTGGATTGTSGTSGSTTAGTTGTTSGSAGSSTGTSGTSGSTGSGSAGTGTTGGSTAGTTAGSAAAGDSTRSRSRAELPFSGTAAGPAAVTGALSLLVGGVCLLLGRPARATSTGRHLRRRGAAR